MSDPNTPLSEHYRLREEVATQNGKFDARLTGAERDISTTTKQSDDNRNSIRKVGWIIVVAVLGAILKIVIVDGLPG